MSSSRSLVVIQSICTMWTKASRGGSNASTRNRTPEALELPALALPFLHDVLVHEVAYSEYDHFQPPREKWKQQEQTDPFWYECLNLSLHGPFLKVTVEWERSKGVPRRRTFPRKGFSLQDRQWGQIAYNLRISSEGGWVYHKQVLNIGLFPLLSRRVFLETEPAHTYADMAQLW